LPSLTIKYQTSLVPHCNPQTSLIPIANKYQTSLVPLANHKISNKPRPHRKPNIKQTPHCKPNIKQASSPSQTIQYQTPCPHCKLNIKQALYPIANHEISNKLRPQCKPMFCSKHASSTSQTIKYQTSLVPPQTNLIPIANHQISNKPHPHRKPKIKQGKPCPRRKPSNIKQASSPSQTIKYQTPRPHHKPLNTKQALSPIANHETSNTSSPSETNTHLHCKPANQTSLVPIANQIPNASSPSQTIKFLASLVPIANQTSNKPCPHQKHRTRLVPITNHQISNKPHTHQKHQTHITNCLTHQTIPHTLSPRWKRQIKMINFNASHRPTLEILNDASSPLETKASFPSQPSITFMPHYIAPIKRIFPIAIIKRLVPIATIKRLSHCTH